jgi:site-specific recombinase XerD
MKVLQAIETFLASLEGIKAPATVNWYSGRLAGLRTRLGEKELHQLTIEDLRQWRGALGNHKLSSWTRHGHVRAVRRLFRWLEIEGHTAGNLAARLELPRLTFVPCQGIDYRDMLSMVRAARDIPREHALVLLLADTAARVGGVAGLTIKDLDLSAGRAFVREKGSKVRPVYFTPRTAAALADYIGQRQTGPVFLSVKGGHRLEENGIYRALQRLAVLAGVKDHWNPHSFRHGAARAMLRRGANLAQVSQILGHSDVSVTVKFYGSFVDEELKQLHRRYSWVSGEK